MSYVTPRNIVLFTVFIDLMGFSIIVPLINYLVDDLDGDIRHVGVLISAYSITQFCFLPIWGRVSDRIGRRPVIIFGLAGSTVSFTIFALADPGLGLTDDLALLFIVLLGSRMVQGAANANLAAAYAYIADITPREKRAKGMGQLGAVFGLGFIIGPAIGGTVGAWHIWAASMVAAGLSGLNLIAALRWLPESLPPEDRQPTKPPLREALAQTASYFRTPMLGRLLWVFGLFILSFSFVFGIYIEFAKEELNEGVGTAGLLFAYMGLISLIIQGRYVDPIVGKLGELRTSHTGLLLMAIGLGLIPFSPNVLVLVAVTTIFSAGSGLIQPSLNALISKAVGPREQGAVLGLNQSLGALARAIGPLAGAFAWSAWGYMAPFFIASGLMFCTLMLALSVRMAAEPGELPPPEQQNPEAEPA